jgi:hypothetical protein
MKEQRVILVPESPPTLTSGLIFGFMDMKLFAGPH